MTGDERVPLACTLDGTAYRERLAWIAELNREGLQSHRRDGLTLELCYVAAVRDRVHQLVRQEADCCAFLGFAVDESADVVRVAITVPDRAGEIAEDLLAPFVPTDAL